MKERTTLNEDKIKGISILINVDKYSKKAFLTTLDSLVNDQFYKNVDLHIFCNQKNAQNIEKELNSYFHNDKDFKFFIYKDDVINTLNKNNFYEKSLLIKLGDRLSLDFLRKNKNNFYNFDLLISRQIVNNKDNNYYLFDDKNFFNYFNLSGDYGLDNLLKTENLVFELSNPFGKIFNTNFIFDFLDENNLIENIFTFYFFFWISNKIKKVFFLNDDYYLIENEKNYIEKIEKSFYLFEILLNKYKDIMPIDLFQKFRISYYISSLCYWGFNINDKEKEILSKIDIDNKKIKDLKNRFKKEDFIYTKKLLLNKIDELWMIKKNILKHKTISFDVFDTLIYRNFWEPTDLFNILSHKVNDLPNIKKIDFFDFKQIRAESENNARNFFKREITLDEIYGIISRDYPFLEKYIDQIKKAEVELEIKYSQERKIAYELFELAKDLNKEIIIVSDMYLSKDIIKNILSKNNYDIEYVKEFYVSCELKKSKSDTQIWKYIIDKENLKQDDIFHIGDNNFADFESPKQNKIKSVIIPKTAEIFKGNTKYYNSFFFEFLNSNFTPISTDSLMKSFGVKTLFSIVANNFFDNPFRLKTNTIDFENDPYFFGFFPLALFMYAATFWLLEKQQKNKYEIFNFNLRDGYLFKIFFDKLIEFKKINVKTNFTNFTRNSLIPILFINEEKNNKTSFLNYFFNFFDARKATYFIDKLKNVISDKDYNMLLNEFKDFEIKNTTDLSNLINFIEKNNINYSEEKFPKEKFKKEYIYKYFKNNKTALFDIGYSGRISTIIKDIFNIDFDEFYINSENDKIFQRIKKKELSIETFYDFIPNFRGWLREFIVSLDDKSCVSFSYKDGGFQEEFDDKYKKNFLNHALLYTMHKGAINFLDKVLTIYSNDIDFLYFRKIDLCIPIEYFYNYSDPTNKEFLKDLDFENDFDWHKSNKKEMTDLLVGYWNQNYSNYSSFFKVLYWSPIYKNFSFFSKVLFWLSLDKKKVIKGSLSFIKNKIKRSLRW